MVARLLWEQDAGGSNPSTRTMASVLTAFEMLFKDTRLFCSNGEFVCFGVAGIDALHPRIKLKFFIALWTAVTF